jgi:endonuclease YncB( thermonuclease family)
MGGQVAAGWARAKPPQGNRDPSAEQATLLEMQCRAESEKRGIFQENRKEAVRRVEAVANPHEFFEKNKGKPLPVLVESVRDGSTVRVQTTASPYTEFLVHIAGTTSVCFSNPVPRKSDLVRPQVCCRRASS